MSRSLFTALLATLFLSAGCPEDTSTDCTAIAVSSVIVTVEDDLGQPIDDAMVTFTVDGGASGSCLDNGTAGEFSCGVEEAGLFEITASAEFHTTESVEVQVTEDECHVLTESVTVTLAGLG